MVSARSPTKYQKMLISKEISDYFTKLVEPLLTSQRLEKMFGKRKEEVIEKFEEKFGRENCELLFLYFIYIYIYIYIYYIQRAIIHIHEYKTRLNKIH